MSYKSPIEVYIAQLQIEREKHLENEVIKAIHGLDIIVAKDELIKALKYDRDQYEKGYADGRLAKQNEVVREIYVALYNEIIDARESNYNAIKERERKHNVNRYEDSFCEYCNGKIRALDGILNFLDELITKYTGSEDE